MRIICNADGRTFGTTFDGVPSAGDRFNAGGKVYKILRVNQPSPGRAPVVDVAEVIAVDGDVYDRIRKFFEGKKKYVNAEDVIQGISDD